MNLIAMPRRDRNHNAIPEWCTALLLFAATAAFVFWQNRQLTVLWDLSYILENAHRMALGQLPYRDFPFPYAPLTFLAQALLIKLFGHAAWHHFVWAALEAGAGVVLAWRIALRLLQGSGLPPRATSLLLALPLVFLSTSSIFPHPFYDADCTVLMLLCLWLMLRLEAKDFPGRSSFFAGALLVVPIFVKQNTGLAFVACCAVCVAWLAWRARRSALWLAAGAASGMCAALAVVQATVGLGNYVHWTITFASSRRLPGLGTMLGVYEDAELLWPALSFAAGLALWLWARRGKGAAWRWSSVALLGVPLLLAVCALGMKDNASERVEALLREWPLLLLTALAASAWRALRRPAMENLVPLIALGAIHGAFLSQQLWGSTYALWPLLVVLMAALLRWAAAAEDERATRPLLALAAASCVALLTCGAYYAVSHERLDYVDLEGDRLTSSRLAALRGLRMSGEYLPQFEQLVAYTEREIPRDDAILELPGEDLFYYSTGRVPRFPVILLDNTVNPYGAAELMQLARERRVQWVIVKRQLQLQEEPMRFRPELMLRVNAEFERVEELDNYDIYRRR